MSGGLIHKCACSTSWGLGAINIAITVRDVGTSEGEHPSLMMSKDTISEKKVSLADPAGFWGLQGTQIFS